MIKKTSMQRWIPSLMAAVALAGSAGLCQAQDIQLLNHSMGSIPATFFDGAYPALGETFTWNATDGNGCLGCMLADFGSDGTTYNLYTGFHVSPAVSLSGYLQVEFDYKVISGSAKCGTGGSGGYGALQVFCMTSGYGWIDGIGYIGAIQPPAVNNWTHFSGLFTHADLASSLGNIQIALQGGGSDTYANGTLSGGAGEVQIEFDNVKVTALPNPFVFEDFTANVQGITPDTGEDAPFYNPVNGSGPTSFTPAGSWEIQSAYPANPTDGGAYPGWNQYGGDPGLALDFTRYQFVGFDVYLDGSSGSEYGGFQMLLFNSGWGVANTVGAVNFNSSMVGKWTHFDFPSAATGNSDCPGFVFQGTPGSDINSSSPATTVTFHIDNVVFWTPATLPKVTGLLPGSPAGVQITLDQNGTLNLDDQEGICSPAADNALKNFFWIGQTPVTYSFSLTNCPDPAAAPGFDAHIYVWNGDSLVADGQSFGYNEGYSGVNWNAGDMISMQVQNGTSGGVVAQFGWKTNLFNGNEPAGNVTTFTFPSMASMNGTWQLNFTDNTDGNITAPDGSVNSFTVPDFSSDPNYTANFAPSTSAISIGVFKNGNVLNDGQSAIFNNVEVSNSGGTVYNDSFSGPGLTANYDWEVAQYWQYAAVRVVWIPAGTAWWLKYNSTASGWSVQSAPDLSTWGDAGATYSYVDNTGTNTLVAIPAAGLPSADFFRLTH